MSFQSCGVWQWHNKNLKGALKALSAQNRVKAISGPIGGHSSVRTLIVLSNGLFRDTVAFLVPELCADL